MLLTQKDTLLLPLKRRPVNAGGGNNRSLLNHINTEMGCLEKRKNL
jgi:hypothetical protein